VYKYNSGLSIRNIRVDVFNIWFDIKNIWFIKNN